ncbi:hypothetical protein [Brevundimonas sp. TSRC1-1]|uniref:hypothetical protein n=1 Tax=Brevundimonas sp. TSRC1-1 TaxID=2804562 RepID=UPI003CF5810D
MTFGVKGDIFPFMITNILDRRTHVHLWRSVDAVAEATWHDNAPVGTQHHDNADFDKRDASNETMAYRSGISVAEAVIWAQQFPDEVTLYLYDKGSWPAGSDSF